MPKPYRFSSGFPDSFQWDSFNFLSAGSRAVKDLSFLFLSTQMPLPKFKPDFNRNAGQCVFPAFDWNPSEIAV